MDGGGPYRTPAPRTTESDLALDTPRADDDLAPILVMFWLASIARVVVAFRAREALGLEPAGAMVAAALVPWLLREVIRQRLSTALRKYKK